MAEISAASEEQRSGIEQVNQAVTQMDQVTQQNAALVEESAAAAQSLQEQAINLAESVSVFNLGEAASQPAAHPQYAHAEPPAAMRAPAGRRLAMAPARRQLDERDWKQS